MADTREEKTKILWKNTDDGRIFLAGESIIEILTKDLENGRAFVDSPEGKNLPVLVQVANKAILGYIEDLRDKLIENVKEVEQILAEEKRGNA